MTRENLKNQVNSKIVNDELSEEEMMHDIMQMVDAHVTQQLILSGVSQQRELLELVTEIANSNQVYSNTRHKLWAKKLISSNCG